ncbi:MAG: hypothetical protein NTY83_01075 [Candidatus Micrarchaeota archaeon]|nr:hypothetical protein [Candidatus Micrarchaeota archaeon]
MVKISNFRIPLDDYRPHIADYMPPLARRPSNCARRMFGKPMAPESIQGTRYLCSFLIDPSSGKNVLKITISNSKSSIGVEMVPRHNEEMDRILPCALFFHLTEKGSQEFEFPQDKMLLVRASEMSMRFALGVLSRPDLDMHAVLMDDRAWHIHPVDRESIPRFTQGEIGSAFVCKKGIFSRDDISKVEIFG